MNFWESFWEILWFSLWAFFFVVYLILMGGTATDVKAVSPSWNHPITES